VTSLFLLIVSFIFDPVTTIGGGFAGLLWAQRPLAAICAFGLTIVGIAVSTALDGVQLLSSDGAVFMLGQICAAVLWVWIGKALYRMQDKRRKTGESI